MSIFDDITEGLEQAAQQVKSSKHYEQDIEPEVHDKTPITGDQRESLDKLTASSFQSPFGNEAPQPGERSVTFIPPGEWVSPVKKHRQRQAMLLPSIKSTDDLGQRIVAVMRFDGAPKEVATAAQKARTAVGAAREAHESARHPDNRRYAASRTAKDAVIQEIAKATTAVSALEQMARRDDVREAWFTILLGNLDKQRAEAAKATAAAAKAYAVWRQTISAADALAKEQGRFGEWHQHPDARELNPLGLIGDLRKARDIANSDDDWVNGNYLTTEYDGIPPHTMAAIEKSARLAPGSFAESVLHRLKSPHKADGPAHDAIRLKDLRIIHTSPIPALNPEQEAWNAHARAVDEDYQQ